MSRRMLAAPSFSPRRRIFPGRQTSEKGTPGLILFRNLGEEKELERNPHFCRMWVSIVQCFPNPSGTHELANCE